MTRTDFATPSAQPAYAALTVQTRELVFIEMWAGQMLCEAFNYVLKHAVKQERPHGELGSGHGFPSSHSQWMGYFAAFLFCHFTFRHRFISTGSRIFDSLRLVVLYTAIGAWSTAVAYSRYYLTYHTVPQVVWGFSIGLLFGTVYYIVVELIPLHRPRSLLGRLRRWALTNPVSTWCRVRDGWAVYPDGGTEAHWQEWRKGLDADMVRTNVQSKKTQ
ncbi:hypothetical protein NM688_g8086 [Phlebia brevispora]|uniref:Uncharacterized protein n=1 Tax=Phlebia brevispora TaxID=194682 RepID=A0ACC1RXI3_9APHY|nr:hypothetical protein NM688_g8086 [Phlebia brevispora]